MQNLVYPIIFVRSLISISNIWSSLTNNSKFTINITLIRSKQHWNNGLTRTSNGRLIRFPFSVVLTLLSFNYLAGFFLWFSETLITAMFNLPEIKIKPGAFFQLSISSPEKLLLTPGLRRRQQRIKCYVQNLTSFHKLDM